jgi:asparagine synthase (glutamine-hydrolysing)
MGIIPLYIGWDKQNIFYVSSELKSLEGICNKIELFPPGHYLDSSDGKLTKWYVPNWTSFDSVKYSETKIKLIHDSLSSAVKRQLMSDVPYGVLLSGGLDSSITSALAKKFASKRIESNDQQDAWWPQLHSFSVGLEGAPDLKAAKIVADHIGTWYKNGPFR